jgi:uncharacterized protein YacL (UPF0231 family)
MFGSLRKIFIGTKKVVIKHKKPPAIYSGDREIRKSMALNSKDGINLCKSEGQIEILIHWQQDIEKHLSV